MVNLAVAGAGEDDCWEFTAIFDCMGAYTVEYTECIVNNTEQIVNNTKYIVTNT